jgi:hypothetical protein
MAAPKKGLALVLSPEGEGPASTPDMEASEYDDAITDVADLLDVSEDKREAFGLAMKRLVMACSEGEE